MSILEKLKDLVAALETEQPKEKQEDATEQEQPVDQDVEEQEEEKLNSDTIEEVPDYLECNEEESKTVWSFIKESHTLKLKLAEFEIRHEKNKKAILNAIEIKNREVLSNLESLRLEYGVPQEGYSVELPSSPEEKVIFKKD